MEGRLCSIDYENRRGRVDTRNDDLGVLTVYFRYIPAELKVNSTIEFDVMTSATGNKYAKFVSCVERNETYFNTEDRSKWYDFGEKLEEDFIPVIREATGRDIRVNPEKKYCPWAIDLFDFSANRTADLKTQTTPFFTAGKYFYGAKRYDPVYTVTFNRKDYEYYLQNYPDSDIYFWVDWKQLEYKDIRIPYICGIWRADFARMSEKIQRNEVALHPYIHRKNDDHNAKDSFLFDLRDRSVFERIR